MEPAENLKFLGAISISIAFIAATFLLRKWERDKTRSISEHAAAGTHSYWLFALTLTGTGTLFYLFMWKWFGPTFDMPTAYYFVLGFAVLNQLVAAWVPDSQGMLSVIHKLTAYTMAAMMPVLGTFILFSSELGGAAKVIVSLMLAVMAAFIVIAFLFKKAFDHYLYFQSAYICSFYLLVLAAAYIR